MRRDAPSDAAARHTCCRPLAATLLLVRCSDASCLRGSASGAALRTAARSARATRKWHDAASASRAHACALMWPAHACDSNAWRKLTPPTTACRPGSARVTAGRKRGVKCERHVIFVAVRGVRGRRAHALEGARQRADVVVPAALAAPYSARGPAPVRSCCMPWRPRGHARRSLARRCTRARS